MTVRSWHANPTSGRVLSYDIGSCHRVRGTSQFRIVLYWTLITFLIIFPKSGVKIGTVPLTTGYAVICAAALLALFDNLLRHRNSMMSFTALVLTGPFGGIVVLSLTSNGATDRGSALAAVMGFVVLPSIFLGLFSCQLGTIPSATIRRSIVFSVRVVSVLGLILFLAKLVTGTLFEVPYLTVNVDDVGLIEKTKMIDRGGIYKLISTYNNGNLFGASMLLLFPLYLWLERSRFFVASVIASLILTLSRTVWLGLLIACLLTMLQKKVTAQLLVGLAFGIALFILVVWLIAGFISNGSGFLIDPTLGGRFSTLEEIIDIALLPSTSVEMLPEIVYAGVVRQFGVLGLLAFIIFLFAPVLVTKIRSVVLQPVQNRAILGIYTYAFICSGDGAVMLIPVIPIFLFVSIILLEAPRLSIDNVRVALSGGRSGPDRDDGPCGPGPVKRPRHILGARDFSPGHEVTPRCLRKHAILGPTD